MRFPASDPSNAANILNKSYTITAEVEIPEGGGDRMIVTEGGGFGGYGLYLLKGKPVFLYNLLALERFRWQGDEVLAPGKHTIVFDFKSDEPGFGKGGTGVLKVDGKEVANQKIPSTIPFLMTLGETFAEGKPFSKGGLANWFRKRCRAVGLIAEVIDDSGEAPLATGGARFPSGLLYDRDYGRWIRV